MPSPAWLEEMRIELERQKLPRAYLARCLEELADHHEDVQLAGHSDAAAAQKLGHAKDIGQAVSEGLRRATFAGRHPWILFAALPLPLMLVEWCAFFLIGGGGLYLLAAWLGLDLLADEAPLAQWPPLLVGYLHALLFLAGFWPPLGLTWAWATLARRAGCGESWVWLSAFLFGLGALSYRYRVFEAADHVQGEFGLQGLPSPLQFAQFLMPLAAAAWMIRRRRVAELALLRAAC